MRKCATKDGSTCFCHSVHLFSAVQLANCAFGCCPSCQCCSLSLGVWVFQKQKKKLVVFWNAPERNAKYGHAKLQSCDSLGVCSSPATMAQK